MEELILTWHEAKRQSNLQKHQLDFADAGEVLQSPYRMDVEVIRNQEPRIQSFAYVFGRLAVLSLAYTQTANTVRVISFRTASTQERTAYYEWLQNTSE